LCTIINIFMKTICCLLLFIKIIFSNLAIAQVPQGIPYQAIARNGQGQPLANLPVKVRFSILDSTLTGTAVYSETHEPTTSAQGLFSVNVGMGNSNVGSFGSINWGVNAKFLKVELDTTASGTNYIDLGTQQMMSVPYALFAGGISYNSQNNNRLERTVVFYQNDTFIVPSNVTKVYVELWGGGQGGSGGYNGSVYCCNYFPGGGGSAGCKETGLVNLIPNEVVLITVGTGGIGAQFSYSGTYSLLSPSPGGDTRFGNYLIAFGGASSTGGCGTPTSPADYYQNSYQNGVNCVGGGRGGTLGNDGKLPGGGGGGGAPSPGSIGGKGGDGLIIIHY